MEAWLAELEMDMVQDRTLTSNPYPYHQHQQSETMETTFDEQLAVTLGEDFPYPLSGESNTSSPDQWEFDYSVVEPFSPSSFIASDCVGNNNDNNNITSPVITNVLASQEAETVEGNPLQSDVVSTKSDDHQPQHEDVQNNEKESEQQTTRTKRKREPSQVQDHIMAERKRRQLLTQRFIALSGIVPGLKKMDKTSVLGEAIKYMKELQEKVKTLEEAAAKRTVESVVVVTKSHLVVDDDDNDSSCTMDSCCASGEGRNPKSSLPEIEVKSSDNNLLLRVYCEKQKGVIPKLFAEVEKHDMSVVNSSVIGFGSLALDITIAAEMEKVSNKNVKDLVRAIRSIFTSASP